jgi:uncharacterized protein YerC
VWADLKPDDRKAQRKSIAERLYKQKFTMEAIATQLGVNHATISRDLKEFVQPAQTQDRKSTRGRTNEGRPKGSRLLPERRKNTSVPAEKAAAEILDEGKRYGEAEADTGLSNIVLRAAVAREEGRREPKVERADLSLTAQAKFDAAIHAYQRKLDKTFHEKVLAEVRKRIDGLILPHWKKQIDQAQQLYRHRRGAMDKLTFNKIRRALHPDSRNSISDKVLAEAFDTFMGLEKFLLNEKDSPTNIGPLPDNLAEWDKMKAAAKAQRKRANGGNAEANR